MVSNLYLKFSELQLLDGDDKPFGSLYGAAASAVLTEFLSPQEIIDMPEEELLSFLAEKSRNRISDISKTSELLKKAARDSYRLDKFFATIWAKRQTVSENISLNMLTTMPENMLR